MRIVCNFQAQSIDRTVLELIEQYEAVQAPTRAETFEHLKALQFRLMRKGFDNWDV